MYELYTFREKYSSIMCVAYFDAKKKELWPPRHCRGASFKRQKRTHFWSLNGHRIPFWNFSFQF